VFLPYRSLRYDGPRDLNVTDVYRKKTRGALALISNCEKASGRLAYIEQLRRYIPVDVYGRCGSPCPRASGLCDRSHYLDVGDGALEPYRFYLAFENSFCPDYISEKFFKAWERQRTLITVARGGFDYRSNFPRGTFIDAADYSGPAQLGRYLRSLVDHPGEYFDLLRRKMSYSVVAMRSQACLMCQAWQH